MKIFRISLIIIIISTIAAIMVMGVQRFCFAIILVIYTSFFLLMSRPFVTHATSSPNNAWLAEKEYIGHPGFLDSSPDSTAIVLRPNKGIFRDLREKKILEYTDGPDPEVEWMDNTHLRIVIPVNKSQIVRKISKYYGIKILYEDE